MADFDKHNEMLENKIKDAIIELMWWKDEMLGKPGYMTKGDEDDVRGYSWGQCVSVVEDISDSCDANCCPPCLVFKCRCSYCLYGKRHGICMGDKANVYAKITDQSTDGIAGIIGRQKVADKIEELFGELREEV